MFKTIIVICMVLLVITSTGIGSALQPDRAGDPVMQSQGMSEPNGESVSAMQDSMADTGKQDETGIITTYPVKPMAGGTITFNLSGTYPSGTQFSWSFGDGTISHGQNPAHTYSGIGRYTVTLEITNLTGSQSVMRKPAGITPNSGRDTGPRGMIWISSSPSDARVSVDRVYIGATPLQSSGIPAGVHRIQVTKDGYREWIGYVQINPGTFTYVPKVILWKNSS